MEPKAVSSKTSHAYLKNFLVRVLLVGVLIMAGRFAYLVAVAGEACNLGDFCFSTIRENLNLVTPGSTAGGGGSSKTPNKAVSVNLQTRRDFYTSKEWINAVQFYTSVFQNLLVEGYLSSSFTSLCLETRFGQDVHALKEIGVADAIGVSGKAMNPLVVSYKKAGGVSTMILPFEEESFDFAFSGGARFEKIARPLDYAAEITRVLKPNGIFVVHIASRDEYSFNSFLSLFNSCSLVTSRDLEGYDTSLPSIREIVLRKEYDGGILSGGGNCSSAKFKLELVAKAEPLIMEEPLKPWITLKRNIQNVKYLPSMADISFKNRYVYVDVGARSYGSSIGSWFRKQYPKQNRTFDVYAIEADKTFHKEYAQKKRVTLLPYAAWITNETLSFEIHSDHDQVVQDKGRGMGRIRPVKSLVEGNFSGEADEIEGFDFAAWLKRTVTPNDFVVMKMDVEGTEFDLIPRLFQTGAICLIDEIFLECHYNRWQRCCPGQRSPKYTKTYGQCLDLMTSLRASGVLVHQWW